MIVAMAGRKRAGKDTACDFLVAEFGFVKVSLADPVRNLVKTLNPLVPFQGGAERLITVLEELGGWEGVKAAEEETRHEVRRMLQHAGTEWGRTIMNGTVWLQAMEQYLDDHHKGWWRPSRGPRICLSDVRFNNEARWVRLNQGKVINIVRPEMDDGDDHPSEAGISLDLADFTVLNVGERTELLGQVRDIVTKELDNHVRA